MEFSDINKEHSVLKFSLEGCGACEAFQPNFEEVAKKYESVPVYQLDVAEEAELAKQFGIKSFPTTVLFKDNKVELIAAGAISKEDLEVFFTANPSEILEKHKQTLKFLYEQSVELDKQIESQKDLIFNMMSRISHV